MVSLNTQLWEEDKCGTSKTSNLLDRLKKTMGNYMVGVDYPNCVTESLVILYTLPFG